MTYGVHMNGSRGTVVSRAVGCGGEVCWCAILAAWRSSMSREYLQSHDIMVRRKKYILLCQAVGRTAKTLPQARLHTHTHTHTHTSENTKNRTYVRKRDTTCFVLFVPSSICNLIHESSKSDRTKLVGSVLMSANRV